MSGLDYDVLIIGGGGSGGFTAATTAMKTGARVGMIESGRLGGLCILAGCMPSKALLHSAAGLRASGQNGLAHYPQVRDFTRGVVEFLAGRRKEAVDAREKKGLATIRGKARLAGPHTVLVEGRRITAGKIVVATGSRDIIPPLPGLENLAYLTSDEFLFLPVLPQSLVVLGGGTLAVEMAQYAQRMGVRTTVIQRSENLMSNEDPKVGAALEAALTAEGAKVYTGTAMEKLERSVEGVRVHFTHRGQPVRVEARKLLLALGRRANTGELGLKEAGVEVDKAGAVVVDRHMQTTQPGIFAAGDCAQGIMVVNLAILQGQTAGYNATHEPMVEIDDRVVPQAVYTDPQFAKVGLSAAEAEKAGIKAVEASAELSELGVSRTYPHGVTGFLNLRAEAGSGRLVGAELVSPEAASIIHEVAMAMKLNGTPEDLASIPHAHPCLAEIVELAAERLKRKVS